MNRGTKGPRRPGTLPWVVATAIILGGALVGCFGDGDGSIRPEIPDSRDDGPSGPEVDQPDLPGLDAYDVVNLDLPPLDPGLVDVAEVITACPAVAPGGAFWELPCAGSLHCEYGVECCCGSCSVSQVCDCGSSGLQCYWTDFCLGPSCSPECDAWGQYITAFGCRTCEQIEEGLRAGIAEALGATVPCRQDADCTRWSPPRDCMGRCDHAVHVDQAAGLPSRLEAVGDDWCRGANCYLPEPPCEEGEPLCIEEACRIVGACDGIRMPLGSACDDGDACTGDDVCVATGTCRGSPVTCDDGNPCTRDLCSKTAGCRSEALDGTTCTPSGACVPGAICRQGTCFDSSWTGWARVLPDQGMDFPFAAVASPSGGLALLLNERDSSRTVPHVLQVDESGATLSDTILSYDTSTEARGIAFGPDGSLVVLAFDYQVTSVVALSPTGERSWRTDVPGVAANPTSIAVDGSGRIGIVGWRQPAEGFPNGWAAVLEPGGKVVKDVDLGPMVSSGMERIASAGSGFTVVLGALDLAPQGELADLRVVRIDETGTITGDRTFHEDGQDFIGGMLVLPGGALVVSGHRVLYGQDDKKGLAGWIRRIENDGTASWQQTTPDVAYRVGRWDSTSIVAMGAAIDRYGLDGALLASTPLDVRLPGGPAFLEGDGLGIRMAGMSSGSWDASSPWVARLFTPCASEPCPRPGCPDPNP